MCAAPGAFQCVVAGDAPDAELAIMADLAAVLQAQGQLTEAQRACCVTLYCVTGQTE